MSAERSLIQLVCKDDEINRKAYKISTYEKFHRTGNMGKQNGLSLRSNDVGLAEDGKDPNEWLKAERRNSDAFVGRIRVRLEVETMWGCGTVNRQVEVQRDLGPLEIR